MAFKKQQFSWIENLKKWVPIGCNLISEDIEIIKLYSNPQTHASKQKLITKV